MIDPSRITKDFLREKLYRRNRNSIFISGSDIHPSKTHYKYYWWVYSLASPFESAEDVFFKDKYKLTTKEFFEQKNELYNKKILFAYVNIKHCRLGSIWDYDKLELEFPDIAFASTYDEDKDESFNGFK